jgi:hypothetical protein
MRPAASSSLPVCVICNDCTRKRSSLSCSASQSASLSGVRSYSRSSPSAVCDEEEEAGSSAGGRGCEIRRLAFARGLLPAVKSCLGDSGTTAEEEAGAAERTPTDCRDEAADGELSGCSVCCFLLGAEAAASSRARECDSSAESSVTGSDTAAEDVEARAGWRAAVDWDEAEDEEAVEEAEMDSEAIRSSSASVSGR